MKLDIFANVGVPEANLHPKFILLRDEPSLFGERAIVESWAENFTDRDNKIVTEFQTTFHSSFWEFYLYKLITDAGLTVDFSRDRPDFIITAPTEVYVEAVVSEIKMGGKNESERKLNDILSMSLPPHLQTDFKEIIDEAIVRHSNAFLGKSFKFSNSYSKLAWVKPDVPFVIALSSYDQINYGREYYFSMVALLFGRYYDPQTRKFDEITTIIKPNTDSTIPVGLFNDKTFEHVSAVIFSCTTTLGKLTAMHNSSTEVDEQLNKVVNIRHDTDAPFFKAHIVSKSVPEELSDGVFIFYNPNAKNPLPQSVFHASNMIHFIPTEDGFTTKGENAPIVARLNLPIPTFPNRAINEIIGNYNS